jgi:Enterobacteriaceae phage serine recombinase
MAVAQTTVCETRGRKKHVQTYQVTELSSDGVYTTRTVEVEAAQSYKRHMRRTTEEQFVVLREIGYARVSADGQDEALQMDALRSAGCTVFFSDRMSGSTKDRPGLAAMMAQLRAGDRVNVWKVDRLGRSTIDSLDLVNEMAAKDAAFRSLTQDFDTATTMGRFIMRILMIFAEFERENIVERVVAGLHAARERGVIGGSRRRLSGEQVEAARAAYEQRPTSPATGKPMTINELAALFGVNRTTFLRWARPDYLLGDSTDAKRFRERHPDIQNWIERSSDPHYADSPRRARRAG